MHKKDQLFVSVPVSRVSLSTRLFKGNSRPVSRSATPNIYVTSSLNPNRNEPVTQSTLGLQLHTQEDFRQFSELPITKDLTAFERVLAELSLLMSSFKDDDVVEKSKLLIDISERISKQVDTLESHQRLGSEIRTLEAQNNALSSWSKQLLKELISCRTDLRKLPLLPVRKRNLKNNTNDVGVEELLEYAMKLAKFSKAPPAVASQPIHPNNYIWPAEDALRRGMLAMASLKPDDLIRNEIGETETDTLKHEEEEGQQEMEIDSTPSAPQQNGRREASKASEPEGMLDLDLFNDEDDSD